MKGDVQWDEAMNLLPLVLKRAKIRLRYVSQDLVQDVLLHLALTLPSDDIKYSKKRAVDWAINVVTGRQRYCGPVRVTAANNGSAWKTEVRYLLDKGFSTAQILGELKRQGKKIDAFDLMLYLNARYYGLPWDKRESLETVTVPADERVHTATAHPDDLALWGEVETAMRLLTERQRESLEWFWSGKTLTELGKEMGICRERVRQLKNEALDILRDELTAHGMYD